MDSFSCNNPTTFVWTTECKGGPITSLNPNFKWELPKFNFNVYPSITTDCYGGHILKQNPLVIYVKLYGERASSRFRVMNALENYFSKYGKIRDVGRLKKKYFDLGDFFIVFKNKEDAVECSKLHTQWKYYPLSPSPQLRIYPYTMKIW
jgi:hypothetical protein